MERQEMSFLIGQNNQRDANSKTVSFGNWTKGLKPNNPKWASYGWPECTYTSDGYSSDSKTPYGSKKVDCTQHRDWMQKDWSRILFTGESRFSLECGTSRVLTGGSTVWAVISIDGRTDLHIIRNCQFDCSKVWKRYRETLHVVPYTEAIGDSFLLILYLPTHLRFDIFKLQETKSPVRLINNTNEPRLVQEHKTPLWVKGDIEDVSSELDKRG
ncbi:hypothetical protein TNCV_365531 [Trichonephila clavipes]|nr:hypothetical protein TNCV_365531 [Trichonephila clavipes]